MDTQVIVAQTIQIYSTHAVYLVPWLSVLGVNILMPAYSDLDAHLSGGSNEALVVAVQVESKVAVRVASAIVPVPFSLQ